MERRYQPGLGLRECWPWQPTAWQMCFGIVFLVTTPILTHNAAEAQDSFLHRSSEALEHPKGWLESLLPPYRWIRWNITTSRHNKHREGIQGPRESLQFAAKAIYPAWPSQELCSMLGQRVSDPLSLLPPSPSGDSLWQSGFIPTFPHRPEEAGSVEEGVNSIDFSHFSRKARTLSINLQAGSDTPPVCALFQQTPSLHNLWRMGHTRWGTACPTGSSARCPTCEISQHLREKVSLVPSRQRSLVAPSTTWSQDNIRDYIQLRRSLYAKQLSDPGYAVSSLCACTNIKLPGFGEENW